MKKVLILISQGSELLEIASFTDVFGWNNILGNKKIKAITGAVTIPIINTWNTKLIPELDLNSEKIDIDEYIALVIPGGFGFAKFFEDMKNPKFKEVINKFYEKNRYIVGVCTGVIPLGEAGILKNKNATTYLYDNDRYFNQLIKYGAIPQKKEIVVCDNIITCSAPKNALECAFLLLKFLTDDENVKKVRHNMGF